MVKKIEGIVTRVKEYEIGICVRAKYYERNLWYDIEKMVSVCDVSVGDRVDMYVSSENPLNARLKLKDEVKLKYGGV